MAYLGSAVGKEPSEEQITVYADLLGDLPGDVLLSAAKRAALEHRIATIPPVGLIRQHAADLIDPPISAEKAFQMAMDVVRGGYSSDRLPEPVRVALQAYGREQLNNSPTGQAMPQFCRLYDSLVTKARAEKFMPTTLQLREPERPKRMLDPNIDYRSTVSYGSHD